MSKESKRDRKRTCTRRHYQQGASECSRNDNCYRSLSEARGADQTALPFFVCAEYASHSLCSEAATGWTENVTV